MKLQSVGLDLYVQSSGESPSYDECAQCDAFKTSLLPISRCVTMKLILLEI